MVVVIVNYNSGPLLLRCIQALNKQVVLPSKVIIVDNNSKDNSLNEIDSSLFDLKIFRLNNNAGFAKANNIALDTIDQCSEYVALLNPDAFPDPHWLEQLARHCHKYPQYSFFASNMLDANNPRLIDGQGDCYHFSGLAWRNKHGQPVNTDTKPSQKPIEIFSACAGAALYRIDDIKAIGGFDEDFFCYMEDIDLCFRLLLIGKKGLYVPKAIVHHIGSAITGKRSDFSIYYGHRNLVWTYFKNMPLVLLILTLPAHIALNLFSLLYFSLKGHRKIIFKAKYDAFKVLPKIFKKRKKIQADKLVSNTYILSLLNKKLIKQRAY